MKLQPMNNTTYTANQNCFLIDGEVYLAKPYSIEQKLVDRYVLVENEVLKCAEINTKTGIGREPEGHPFIYDGALIVTHSTKPLEGLKQLPRDMFVKPKDVEKMADDMLVSQPDYDSHDPANGHFIWGFQEGHNANPNEFNRANMEAAFRAGIANSDSIQNASELLDAFNWFMQRYEPLSLPASLEINEQGEIVNVIW